MTSQGQAAADGDSLTLEPEGDPGAPGLKGIPELAGRTPRQLAWIRFKRDRTGIVCAVVVALFIVIALAAPLIAKLYGKNAYDLYGQDDGLLNSYGLPIKPNGGISGQHWFGVEPSLGRDVFTLLIYGIRTSLLIALAVTVISTAIGVLFGLTQGYLGGRTDYFMGRFSDFMLSFPQQLFFIAFSPVAISLLVKPGNAETLVGPAVRADRGAVRARLDEHRPTGTRPGAEPAGAGVRRSRPDQRRLLVADHPQGTAAQHLEHHPGAVDPDAPGLRHRGGGSVLPRRRHPRRRPRTGA